MLTYILKLTLRFIEWIIFEWVLIGLNAVCIYHFSNEQKR